MKRAHLSLAVALSLAIGFAVHGAALAQAPVAPPASAASAASAPPPKPPEPKPGPRVLSPAESRDNGIAEDLKPERPVTPQISIPLGKTRPVEPKPTSATMKRNGGIDDAAARCESLSGEQVRVKCRDKLARETGNR